MTLVAPRGGTDVQTLLLPISRENDARGRKGTRARLFTLSTRVRWRVLFLLKPLLERGLLPRARTTGLSSGLLLSPPRLPLGRAIGHPETLLPAVLAAASRLRVARAHLTPGRPALLLLLFCPWHCPLERQDLVDEAVRGGACRPAQQSPKSSPLLVRPSTRDTGAPSSAPSYQGQS